MIVSWTFQTQIIPATELWSVKLPSSVTYMARPVSMATLLFVVPVAQACGFHLCIYLISCDGEKEFSSSWILCPAVVVNIELRTLWTYRSISSMF